MSFKKRDMLDKKEKLVMSYLSEVCKTKRTYLILSTDIAQFVSQKCIISLGELDDIMIGLEKDNYIDFVVSDGKKGYYYCVSLKNKGITYKKDIKKEKQQIALLLVRTLVLAVVSFVMGLLLKAIFGG
ncbi:MAG: hypothetical protein IJA69_02625 [Clostridia bacterium]|nr:hypothetical protein [Clostridia bacterium]